MSPLLIGVEHGRSFHRGPLTRCGYTRLYCVLSRSRQMRATAQTIFAVALALSIHTGCRNHADGPPGESFDAGPVFAATTPRLTHQFLVTNTTPDPVRILDEIHSCTCTSVELARKTLAPGESTPLTMHVDILDSYFQADLSCTIKTDHPRYPDWTYHLRYQSFPRSRLASDRLDLGVFSPGEGPETSADLATGRPREAWLEFYAPADGSLPRSEDIDLVGIPEELAVELDHEPQIETWPGGGKRARFRLRVGLKDDVRKQMPGSHSRGFNILLGKEFGPGLTAVWRVNAPVTASPSPLHFGIATPGGPSKMRRVQIRSAKAQPFRLLSAACDSPAMAAALPRLSPSAPSHTVEITFSPPPGETASSLSGTIQFETDLAAFPAVRVPWSVFLRRSENSPSIDRGEHAAEGGSHEE